MRSPFREALCLAVAPLLSLGACVIALLFASGLDRDKFFVEGTQERCLQALRTWSGST